MYRVMIIDDEKSLRKLLRATVKWEELNLEVVGEASSGIEAINVIDEIRPDIVFVDAKMPFMNGIDFSRMAIERYPRLQIIILTAFGEFEYARQCIGIGVSDYLLKPIVASEIVRACKKAINQLDNMPKEEVREGIEDNNSQRICEYIKMNFRDSQINLESIAQEFGFNSSYLSRRFKGEMGVGVIDYITQCRMKKALICAKEGKLMYMTAQEVGIPDPNYFGKCFKRYIGYSYSEAVKKYQEGAEIELYGQRSV